MAPSALAGHLTERRAAGLLDAGPANLRELAPVSTDACGLALAAWPGVARLSRLDLTPAVGYAEGLRALSRCPHLRKPGVVHASLRNPDEVRGVLGGRRSVESVGWGD